MVEKKQEGIKGNKYQYPKVCHLSQK
jgi:hypothetical protein